jgi:hypothetical protein
MRIEWKSGMLALLGLVAIAWIATDAVGAIANSPKSAPAVSAFEEAICNPRDPLSACFREPQRGIPVGDLLVEDDPF